MDESNTIQWDGTNPPSHSNCPYIVEFVAKPIPSNTLTSMEAGKVEVYVELKGSTAKVESLTATMINNIKQSAIPKTEEKNRDKELKANILLINLFQEEYSNHWRGEFSIPVTWIEGGTKAFERSGSYNPHSDDRNFSMDITYRLYNGKNCVARFYSTDAFHWSMS